MLLADDKNEPDSMTLFDYREKEAIITKLIDTNELFMQINVKLLDQKDYKHSNTLKKATAIM